ncbi:hypothetical protein [Nonomuraea sp. NPDC005692]|uniref:hypothetical protein n=1 Tax=Nonomuraea sp. NPDC005692 TaxID=3157168 RepID=UPI0033D60CC7
MGWRVKGAGPYPCGNGRKHYLKIKAKKGANYTVILDRKGREHTIEYRMQNELRGCEACGRPGGAGRLAMMTRHSDTGGWAASVGGGVRSTGGMRHMGGW